MQRIETYTNLVEGFDKAIASINTLRQKIVGNLVQVSAGRNGNSQVFHADVALAALTFWRSRVSTSSLSKTSPFSAASIPSSILRRVCSIQAK